METSLVILTFVIFFIKDVLQRENIDLEHCPTERMIADFYTKPLQGALFIKLRNFIIGLDDAFCEERVEKRDNSDKPSREQNGHALISFILPFGPGRSRRW